MPEYLITRIVNGKQEFLRHEVQHFWTTDRKEAMTYSKKEVADELARKMVGTVIPANQ